MVASNLPKVSTPQRKSRPSSPPDWQPSLASSGRFNPSKEITAVLTPCKTVAEWSLKRFNPSKEITAVLTRPQCVVVRQRLFVSTPQRKTRPSSLFNVGREVAADMVSTPLRKTRPSSLTVRLAKWLGPQCFNPSQENTAVLTCLRSTNWLSAIRFQPLSGKHGRPHFRRPW